jgi:transcription elongation factor Elf1
MTLALWQASTQLPAAAEFLLRRFELSWCQGQEEIASAMQARNPVNTLYCSFCGKSETQVRKMIAGAAAFICDECIRVCVEVLRKEGIDIPPEVGFGEYDPDSRISNPDREALLNPLSGQDTHMTLVA